MILADGPESGGHAVSGREVVSSILPRPYPGRLAVPLMRSFPRPRRIPAR